MATVRFSRELIERIEKNARAKMDPAVTRAKESRPDNKWGQHIYDTLFLDVQSILTQLPAHWLRTTDNFAVAAIGGLDCSLDFKLSAPRPWPREFAASELARRSGYYDTNVELLDHPAWTDFRAEVVAYIERVKAATNRRTEFVSMVRTVCNAYSTLAPALKAWPALWELIPEDVKEKHRQVVEREKKEVKLEVDLNKLTAMSAAAKFGV